MRNRFSALSAGCFLGSIISHWSGTEPTLLPRSHERAAEIGPRCSSVISKCYNNTQKDSYHESKEMDSASDASELPPLYHGLTYCDRCLHGTLPGKIQTTLSIPKGQVYTPTSGLTVRALASGSIGPGSSPGQGQRVVFLCLITHFD